MEKCPITREYCDRDECHWWVNFHEMQNRIKAYMSDKAGRLMRAALSQVPNYAEMFDVDGMCSVKLRMITSS